MLKLKDLVLMNDKAAKKYTAYEIDRVYLDLQDTDKTKPANATNNKELVKWEFVKVYTGRDSEGKTLFEPSGKTGTWEGLVPVNKVTDLSGLTQEEIDTIVGQMIVDACNHLLSLYGSDKAYSDIKDVNTKGQLLLLSACQYGADLWLRSEVQGDHREKPAESPEDSKKKFIARIIADAKANGKVISEAKAEKIYAASQAALMEEEEVTA